LISARISQLSSCEKSRSKIIESGWRAESLSKLSLLS
jgi:hypothetical protein